MNASRARPTTGMFQDANNSTSGENTENESAAPKKAMEWSADNEEILVEWGDTAQCYKWLHTECHRRFSVKHAWYTIPAIIFSTIAGTASFAQSSLSRDAQFYASLAIGTVNIFVGILSTVQEYLKISERRESHRVAFVSWDKYARNIRVELAKTPMERADAHHFIKVCRSEYDRLMETSPSIHEDTIVKFFKTFSGSMNSERRAHFDILKKPDICNSIVSMNETRRRWFDDQQTRPAAYFSPASSTIRSGDGDLWNSSLVPKKLQRDFVFISNKPQIREDFKELDAKSRNDSYFRSNSFVKNARDNIRFRTLFQTPKLPQNTTEFYDTSPIAIFERDKLNIQITPNIEEDAIFKETEIDVEMQGLAEDDVIPAPTT